MSSSIYLEEFSEFRSTDNVGNCVILEEISNALSWESAEALFFRALPFCEVYSVRPSLRGWCVEVEYDSLLHEGTGATQQGALSDALRGILDTLKFSNAS